MFILKFKYLSYERNYCIYLNHLIVWSQIAIRSTSIRLIKRPSIPLKYRIYTCIKCNCNKPNQFNNAQIIIPALSNNIWLKTVLQDLNGFNIFTNYCVKEFSVESPLFLFELSQLRHYITQQNIIGIDNISFHIDISNCLIKNEFNGMNTIVSLITHIYNEYLIPNSTLEINVPTTIKGEAIILIQSNIINTHQKDTEISEQLIIQIYNELTKCGKCIYSMLSKDTFIRFKKTHEYIDWSQNYSSQ